MSSTSTNAAADERVLEMSVEETNALRARLGLPPLRGVVGTATTPKAEASSIGGGDDATAKEGGEETVVLEMSVEETNQVRASLGLPPLRTTDTTIVHAPPPSPIREDVQALRQQVEQNAQHIFGKTTLADALNEHESMSNNKKKQSSSTSSWAQAMRQQQQTVSKTIPNAPKTTRNTQQKYDESDLKGVRVQHDLSELWNQEDDNNTPIILTLTDAPILQVSHDHAQKVLGLNDAETITALENVELVQQQRAKRKYEQQQQQHPAWTEEEEEYGLYGAEQDASWIPTMKKKKKTSKGFRIGDDYYTEQEEEQQQPQRQVTDTLVSKTQISLQEKDHTVATDYMTVEEAEELYGKPKFKKKRDKKKNKHGRIRSNDEEEDDNDDEQARSGAAKRAKSLLQELEENAVPVETIVPKRRRDEDDDEPQRATAVTDDDKKNRIPEERFLKYESIMAKGNERSKLAFAPPKRQTVSTTATSAFDDEEEPDDAFLNAALAKSRRLQQLQNLEKMKLGAQAVVDAVRQPIPETVPSSSKNTITFSIDETREFTIALRAKTEQTERENRRKKEMSKVADSETGNIQTNTVKEEETTMTVKQESGENGTEPEEDLNELAKQVREVDVGLEGTGNSAPLGRGLGSILGVLKQTGELSRKNAGKEEMRGRAKDKRTYEDYEPLNLSEVVRIDEKAATDKDRELAHREVKLEYRDKYGRLLTRKEAFRELSYQFHGYGSGKRKEEKKQQQIAREQAEARLASRQAAEAGIFGAVKKTQKATGKAFIIHKTGT